MLRGKLGELTTDVYRSVGSIDLAFCFGQAELEDVPCLLSRLAFEDLPSELVCLKFFFVGFVGWIWGRPFVGLIRFLLSG